jgi:hypothetical protein
MTTADQRVEEAADKLQELADRTAGEDSSPLRARTNGDVPTNQQPGSPSPWLVVGVALAAGILLAKWIDRRGHARSGD